MNNPEQTNSNENHIISGGEASREIGFLIKLMVFLIIGASVIFTLYNLQEDSANLENQNNTVAPITDISQNTEPNNNDSNETNDQSDREFVAPYDQNTLMAIYERGPKPEEWKEITNILSNSTDDSLIGLSFIIFSKYANHEQLSRSFTIPYNREALTIISIRGPKPEEWKEITNILFNSSDKTSTEICLSIFSKYAKREQLTSLVKTYYSNTDKIKQFEIGENFFYNLPANDETVGFAKEIIAKEMYKDELLVLFAQEFLNKHTKVFSVPYDHEALSYIHSRGPKPEEWVEITNILLHSTNDSFIQSAEAIFSAYARKKQLDVLVNAYNNPVNDDTRQRILDIFYSLQGGEDAILFARQMVANDRITNDDKLMNGAALLLARSGDEIGIKSIIERINNTDDIGNNEDEEPSYTDIDGLIGTLSQIGNPKLEDFLKTNVMKGGVAKTNRARMALIRSLSNYHTVPVTEVLYHLSQNDENKLVRKTAEETLKIIQTPE